MPDLWIWEKASRARGYMHIAGVDEAGRGPLAGPVIAAAVILPDGFSAPGLTDSKKLSIKQRERFYHQILSETKSVGVGISSPMKIDRVNILRASLTAMADAVRKLDPTPDYLLIDGNQPVQPNIPQISIPKGDGLSISIAAASIVAKVFRDRIMTRFDKVYPAYGFKRHKGYPTRDHREAIGRHGVTPIHRKTFKGVREFIHPPPVQGFLPFPDLENDD